MVEETGEGGGSCEVKEVISSSFEYELLYIGERASQVVLVVKNLPPPGSALSILQNPSCKSDFYNVGQS